MGLFAANLRFYLQLLALLKEGKSQTDISKTLKKNPYFLKMVMADVCKHHTLSDIQHAICYLATLDVAIKSGDMAAKHAIFLALNGCLAPAAVR